MSGSGESSLVGSGESSFEASSPIRRTQSFPAHQNLLAKMWDSSIRVASATASMPYDAANAVYNNTTTVYNNTTNAVYTAPVIGDALRQIAVITNFGHIAIGFKAVQARAAGLPKAEADALMLEFCEKTREECASKAITPWGPTHTSSTEERRSSRVCVQASQGVPQHGWVLHQDWPSTLWANDNTNAMG